MAICPSCDRLFGNGAVFCNVCGLALLQKPAYATPTSTTSLGIRASQIVALAMGLLVLAIQWFITPSLAGQALLLSVASGCAVVIARWPLTARLGEKAVSYVAEQMVNAKTRGRFRRWIKTSVYGICNVVASLTKRIEDPFIRTGVQLPFFIVLGGLGIAFAATAAFLIIYVIIVCLVLLLGLWILSKLSDRDGESLRAGDVFSIKGGSLTKRGILGENLGKLRRRDYETLETSNLTKPNVRLVENRSVLGPDPSAPYRVEDEDGEHLGRLVNEPFNDGLRFEPEEDESS